MSLHPVQESQWRPLQNSSYSIDAIRKKAKRIVMGLGTVVKEASERGDPNISITALPDSDILGNVETDFGNGRLRLRWQSDAKELFGLLVFERELLDHLDRRMWEVVLDVKIPADGAWKIGGTVTSLGAAQNLNESDKLYVFGLSILYTIINGPSLA